MRLEKLSSEDVSTGHWRCRRGGCRKSKSILADTIFENSKISISATVQIVYMHCLEIKVKYISSEPDVGEKTIYSTSNTFYKKIDEDNSNYAFDKLGGPDAIIEVDETHICSRKDNRGRVLAGERYWVTEAIFREKIASH
ncbi:hypothetical protein ENBRE01_3188 [Enteropsectra breve]|nr:hypothetical protein ENBRE01_3188 [Enteropsectra breve]